MLVYEKARRILPNVSWGEYHGDDVMPQGFDNWRRINPDGVANFLLEESTEPGGRRFAAEGTHNGFVLAAQPIGGTFTTGRLVLDCDFKTPANWVWSVACGVGAGFGDAGLWTAGHQKIGAHMLVSGDIAKQAKGDTWYRLKLAVDLDARIYDTEIFELGKTSVPAESTPTAPAVVSAKGEKIKSSVREVSTLVLRAYDCGSRMPEGQADERILFDNIRVTANGAVVYFNDGSRRERSGEAKNLQTLAATAIPPKSNRVRVVDFTSPMGTVRALNGINGGPSVKGRAASGFAKEFAQLNVSSVRLHDIPLVNSGMKLVDVQDIFPIWNEHADVADPDNYFFAATDDYLKTLRGCGVKQVIYRLGTSIEWAYPNKYFAKRPKDPARYAEICAGIMRHYVKGWAKGPVGLVSHWEIWNEANIGNAMWDGTWEDYVAFYCVVAKRLKQEFPNERIGGPALCGGDTRQAAALMDAAKAAGAPLDFFSWHGYDKTPGSGVTTSKTFRRMLDERGFTQAELHFNEWHYFPCTWTDVALPAGRRRWFESADGTSGIDSAAFTTLCLTVWQESPMTMSNFYMTTPNGGAWALYDPYGFRRRTWFAMEFFGMVAGQARVKADTDNRLGVLASVSAEGRRRILVSDFLPDEETGSTTLDLRGLPQDGQAKVRLISDGQVEPRVLDLTWTDGRLTLPKQDGSSVWMIEL